MLSDGKDHLSVPKNLIDNLRWRVWLLTECHKNPAFRRGIQDLCKHDILFWINSFIWQYNPTKLGREVGPMICWPYQERALLATDTDRPGIVIAIERQHDLFIEKSREMGASVLCLLVFDWLARFWPNIHLHCISRNKDAVECQNPDSLFWKMNFFHRHLPEWCQDGVEHQLFHYAYPNGSTITGEASTECAGIGGRATAMFIDELSRIKRGFDVVDGTSDTTRCRIFNGTHKGLDTAFYHLSRDRSVKKLVMHWSEHPDKVAGLYRSGAKIEVLDKHHAFDADYRFVLDGSPSGGPHPGLRSVWYDDACRRKTSQRGVAEDLDIDPAGSISQVFDQIKIRQLIDTYCRPADWEGELDYDARTATAQGLEKKKGGKLRLWLEPHDGAFPPGKYCVGFDISAGTGATPSCASILEMESGEKIGEYGDANIDPTDLAPWAVALCRMLGGALLAWEIPGPGVTFGKYVLRIGYSNIHYRTNELRAFERGVSDVPGWHNNNNSMRSLIEEYKAALYNCQYLNRSEKALEETKWFEYQSGGDILHSGSKSTNDPSGARLNHGDQTIADAITWMLGRQFRKQAAPVLKPAVPLLSLAWRRALAQNTPRDGDIVWS